MKLHVGSDGMEHVEGLHSQYPYVFHLADLDRTSIPWHWHEALEFDYVAEGRVKVSTAGISREFGRGQGFFTNSNVLSTMESMGGCVLESHLFHPVFLSGHFQSVFETKYLNPVTRNRSVDLVALPGDTANQRQLLALLRQLSLMARTPDSEFQTRNLLSQIWLLLLEELKTLETTLPKNQERILTMLAFIQENFREKLTLEQIAGSAAVSTRECLRCFRESIRQSPMEYLISYRISVARKLLEDESLSVTDVALSCGFNSPAYFAKLFHRACGKPPRDYRRSLPKQNAEF